MALGGSSAAILTTAPICVDPHLVLGMGPSHRAPSPSLPIPCTLGAVPHLWAQQGRLQRSGGMVAKPMSRCPLRAGGSACSDSSTQLVPPTAGPSSRPALWSPALSPPSCPASLQALPFSGCCPSHFVSFAPPQRGSCSNDTDGSPWLPPQTHTSHAALCPAGDQTRCHIHRPLAVECWEGRITIGQIGLKKKGLKENC